MKTRNVLVWGLVQTLLKPRLRFSSKAIGYGVSPGWAYLRYRIATHTYRAQILPSTQDGSLQSATTVTLSRIFPCLRSPVSK